MSCFVIGVGGTGAKCVEALIHLCAAGLMPDNESLYALFVDPDGANGNLERARNTMSDYAKCCEENLGVTNLFKTSLAIADPDVWSPFGDEAKPTLGKFFHYNTLKEENQAAAHLFDVLYSPEEKETTLEKGFRGHPSIGAAVLASAVDFGNQVPWKTFRQSVEQSIGEGGIAKIILIGSIFGGTGASGLPTIARLIRNKLAGIQNVRIGGILVLPYFSFKPVEEGGIKAASEDFLTNTQAALLYYHQKATEHSENQEMDLRSFKTVYSLGEAQLSSMKTSSLGGQSQCNEPHFIELYSALACLDFFKEKDTADGYPMLAREQESSITWSDLPNYEELRLKLEQLTRFSYAYLTAYRPMLKNIAEGGSQYRAPWYIDFFKRAKLNLNDTTTRDSLKRIEDYCTSYLQWLANITASTKTPTVKLVDYNTFAERKINNEVIAVDLKKHGFDLNSFDNLLQSEKKEPDNGLNNLWARMCSAKVKDPNAVGVGRFFRALYDECGKK